MKKEIEMMKEVKYRNRGARGGEKEVRGKDERGV